MAYPIYHSQYTAAQIEATLGKSPRINANNTWEVWDIETSAYVDTGISAGVSAPFVVTLAADMTNTGMTYIYAGSEAGYNFGHWYYYDGAAWTDGGAYQAAAADGAVSLTSENPVQNKVVTQAIYDSYPHATTESGYSVEVTDGADNVSIRSASVDLTGYDYAVAPEVYIDTTGQHDVLTQTSQKMSHRCIVFPCEASTAYTVTVAVSATLRIGSFQDYPIVGATPSQYANASGTSVSVTTGASDKWIMCQLFTDGDNLTFSDVTGNGFGISPAPIWESVKISAVGKNIAPPATLSYRWDANNTLQTGAMHTPFFRVIGGKTYTWSVTTARAGGRTYMVWLDDNMSIIGNSSISADFRIATVTAPNNAVWASLSLYSGQGNEQFEIGSTATDYEAYSEQNATLDISGGDLSAPIYTKYGNNAFYADAGEITVDYHVDPTMFVNNKINAVMAAIAAL